MTNKEFIAANSKVHDVERIAEQGRSYRHLDEHGRTLSHWIKDKNGEWKDITAQVQEREKVEAALVKERKELDSLMSGTPGFNNSFDDSAPCDKYCPHRTATCHSACKLYIDWKATGEPAKQPCAPYTPAHAKNVRRKRRR